jgi:DNA-nicking Smr family endonuclease
LKQLVRQHQLRLASEAERRAAERRAAEQVRARAEAARAGLSLEDRELFAQHLGRWGGVQRLAHAPRAHTGVARPAPLPRQRELDEERVLHESISDEFDPVTLMETDGELAWQREGLSQDVLRRLRLGQWAVQGQVDLHGHTRDAARLALVAFLQRAGREGWRCVRVVHGKGLGSPGRTPVLKGKVRAWLVQREEVLAFTQARGPDGGAGALIVLLDTPRRGSAAAATAGT